MRARLTGMATPRIRPRPCHSPWRSGDKYLRGAAKKKRKKTFRRGSESAADERRAAAYGCSSQNCLSIVACSLPSSLLAPPSSPPPTLHAWPQARFLSGTSSPLSGLAQPLFAPQGTQGGWGLCIRDQWGQPCQGPRAKASAICHWVGVVKDTPSARDR